MKFCLNILALLCCLLPPLVYSNETTKSLDYREWLALVSLEQMGSKWFENRDYQNLTPEEVEVEVFRNAVAASKSVANFEGGYFSDAMSRLEELAVKYSDSQASYALASLSWDRIRLECEVKGDCDWEMTKKMQIHFEIAARSDPTGGAAFGYAHVIARVQGSDWRESSRNWGRLGKSKKLALLEKEYKGK